jgi:predicted component of type VI protein secretion system
MSDKSDDKNLITITYMSGRWDGRTVEWEYTTDEGEVALTIGRRQGCTIFLDCDTQVSRLHARVVYQPESNTFYLEDAGSRNGTFIGDNRLTGRLPITPGTLFRVGRTWLRLDPQRPAPEKRETDNL